MADRNLTKFGLYTAPSNYSDQWPDVELLILWLW